MWASGNYPSMVETWLLPLVPQLVDACRVGPGTKVLDFAAGTGNASLEAARTGAHVTASDLTPELLEAGRARADAAGLELAWDESFDAVMSAIGVMFAPHHLIAADELIRVCRPAGRSGCSAGRPRGTIGGL